MKKQIRDLVALMLALAPMTLHAQGISGAVVRAPQVILVSGVQMQLAAVARDNQGNPRNNDTFVFTSSNPAVISVDASGIVTAKNPGVASITATVQGTAFRTPAVLLQVIPLRINVSAATPEITVGAALQLNATALDVNGQPIPDVVFRWQVTGANGFNSRSATINSSGLLTTNGIGLMTIHAQIVYSGQSLAHTPIFEGLTQILISARKEFKLSRLVANSTLDRGFALRPAYNSEPAINDSGQIAFAANLDGLGRALMFYENGKFEMLASAGTPGPLGGYIWDFDGIPAINNRGDVLVRVGTSYSWGLMRASKSSGLSFILENGVAEGFARMSFFRVGRYSINDQGDMVFLADFQFTGIPVWHTGLFLLNDRNFRSIWANTEPLPSFPPDFTFDNSMFGVDSKGAVYFRVSSGRNNAIFRADGMSEPKKIAGTGTTIDTPLFGSIPVRDVQNLALSPNGTVAFNVTAASGSVGIVRLQSGSENLEYLPQRSVGLVLSVNDLGDTLYTGDPGQDPWWGVYAWQNTAAQFFRLSSDFVLEGGEKPIWARTGKITPGREAYVSLDSAENHLLMARVDARPRTIWKGGMVLNLKANLNFLGAVPVAQSGAVHTFGGGTNASILEVAASAVRTIWAPGDHPAQGISGTTITHASKNPGGDIYMTLNDGIMRIRNGSAETLGRFPLSDRDKTTLRGPAGWYDGNNSFSVNSSGAFVFNARTDNENRLELYDQGVFVPILVQGGSNQTASPGGGRFANIAATFGRQNAVVIDERGRVLVNAQVAGGPSGLFLYENGQWRSAALFFRTSIGGAAVSGCRTIHVAGENFYALLDMTNGDVMIAQYDGLKWTPLIRRYDVMPDGTSLNNFYNAFAVNRGGDIVYAVNGNGEKIVLRTADGVNHLVYSEMSATEDGDRFPGQTFEFDIRDDGQIYFVGFDATDRNTIYKAERIR